MTPRHLLAAAWSLQGGECVGFHLRAPCVDKSFATLRQQADGDWLVTRAYGDAAGFRGTLLACQQRARDEFAASDARRAHHRVAEAWARRGR